MTLLSPDYDIVERPLKFVPPYPHIGYDRSLAENIRHKYVRGPWAWALTDIEDRIRKQSTIALSVWEVWCQVLSEVFVFDEHTYIDFEHLIHSDWMDVRISRRAKKIPHSFHTTATIKIRVEPADIGVLDSVCPKRILLVRYVNGKFEIYN